MPGKYDIHTSGAFVQTSTSASVAVTVTPPANATGCIISVDTNDARITLDGTTATTTVGHLVKSGQAYPWYVPLAKPISFISTTSTTTISTTWLYN